MNKRYIWTSLTSHWLEDWQISCTEHLIHVGSSLFLWVSCALTTILLGLGTNNISSEHFSRSELALHIIFSFHGWSNSGNGWKPCGNSNVFRRHGKSIERGSVSFIFNEDRFFRVSCSCSKQPPAFATNHIWFCAFYILRITSSFLYRIYRTWGSSNGRRTRLQPGLPGLSTAMFLPGEASMWPYLLLFVH